MHHLFRIPQCIIQNRNVHISVLNGALWVTGQVHCGICEIVPKCCIGNRSTFSMHSILLVRWFMTCYICRLFSVSGQVCLSDFPIMNCYFVIFQFQYVTYMSALHSRPHQMCIPLNSSWYRNTRHIFVNFNLGCSSFTVLLFFQNISL